MSFSVVSLLFTENYLAATNHSRTKYFMTIKYYSKSCLKFFLNKVFSVGWRASVIAGLRQSAYWVQQRHADSLKAFDMVHSTECQRHKVRAARRAQKDANFHNRRQCAGLCQQATAIKTTSKFTRTHMITRWLSRQQKCTDTFLMQTDVWIQRLDVFHGATLIQQRRNKMPL